MTYKVSKIGFRFLLPLNILWWCLISTAWHPYKNQITECAKIGSSRKILKV